MDSPSSDGSAQEQLSALFGSYRAEWLNERIFDLFTEPAYLPELTGPQACVLEGGRGTGKTTVLRGLSYEGQFALGGRRTEAARNLRFVGCYLRVDTNAVTAFTGPEVTEAKWAKLFGHYFNLLLCGQVCRFLIWYEGHCPGSLDLGEDQLADACAALHLPGAVSVPEMSKSIRKATVVFEAQINNVSDLGAVNLSLQGAPVRYLCSAVRALPAFKNKPIFFLLDEYENFEPYQQQVVNTLIKHAGTEFTLKISIRELGWKRRSTLYADEQLISPADYVRIAIRERLTSQVFADFSRKVCNDRIRLLDIDGRHESLDIESLLPSLSEEQEAQELGVAAAAARVRADLRLEANGPAEVTAINVLPDFEAYFVDHWATHHGSRPIDVFRESVMYPGRWRDRFGNYKYSLLFGLKSGKRGIRKYYTGWDTYLALADGNIRFLLALVDRCLGAHLREVGSLGRPVSAEVQTRTAQLVGKETLAELEGLTVHGAKLTKLVLGLGRVFGVLAAQPGRHAPEVNQFDISDDPLPLGVDPEAVSALLRAGVMHLALTRQSGTKPTSAGDTRDYDYMLHPLFSAFFAYSHRRKRKLTFSESDIYGLVHRPTETIKGILERHNRTDPDDLPDQMSLFQGYFRART